MSTPIVIAILMNTVITHTVVKNRCLDQREYCLIKKLKHIVMIESTKKEYTKVLESLENFSLS